MKIRLLTAIILTISASYVYASDTDDSQEKALQLDALVGAVLERNSGLKSVDEATRAATFRIAPASALPDPMLTYAGAPDTAGGPRGFQERVEISQTLPWPGKLDLQKSRASAQAEATASSYEDRRLLIIAAAKQLYAEWAYIHQSLDLKYQHRELLQEMVGVAKARYSAGKALQQEVLQAEVEAAQIDTEIVSHHRRKVEVLARLNALLNRPPTAALPPPAGLPESVELPGMPTLQSLALENHPELHRLRSNVRAAKSELGLAEKDYFPDFKLAGGYNSLWDDEDKRWWLGVSINIPFDFSNKRDASRDAANAEVMRYQWALSDSEARIIADLQESLARVSELEQTLTIYRERLLPLARASLETSLANYRSGKSGFITSIDAQRKQLQTEDAFQRTRSDYLRALALVERYIAKPLTSKSTTSHSNHPSAANLAAMKW